MKMILVSVLLFCFPLSAWADSDPVSDVLQEFMEFAEYAEGVITSEQLTSVGLSAFTLVDTRLARQYEASHIPGAIHIEWREILSRRDELPQDKPLVLYCDSGLLSSKAHFALRLVGHDNVKVLSGGYDGWKVDHEISVP